MCAKLRKVERNAKEKLVFLLISETKDLWNTLYLQVKELRGPRPQCYVKSLVFASLQEGSCLCCCPVFVQCTTEYVLHKYCTSTAQDSKQIPCYPMGHWGCNHFYEIVQAEEHFHKRVCFSNSERNWCQFFSWQASAVCNSVFAYLLKWICKGTDFSGIMGSVLLIIFQIKWNVNETSNKA